VTSNNSFKAELASQVGLIQALGGMVRSLAFTVIFLAICACASTGERPRLISVADVTPGAWLESVLALRGKPLSESRPADFVELVHHYEGLEVGYFQSQVVHIRATGSSWCTAQGLCPGNSTERMQALYGAPRIRPSRPNTAIYWQSGPDCWYEFELSRGTVAAVGMACQP
jgi:hypothetical protein